VRQTKFRLDRDAWEARARPPVAIAALEPCLPLFGL
jgi:hypothetical protein